MLDRWDFQLATQIRFGRKGLRKLGEAARPWGASALLVGYRDRTGLDDAYAQASKSLSDAGIAVTEFFEVPPDPDARLPVEGAKLAKDAGAEVIVALGGGSAIDAAKGIAVAARTGDDLWSYTGANPDVQAVGDALPVIAIPTTAGTGTEVSAVAVFTHEGVGSVPGVPIKASISSPAIRPKVALIDPDLAVGSPAALTAACGADALGHAIESCMSRRANPLSAMLAGRAVGLIVKNLEAAVENPDDLAPREPLALAATLAGAAFSSAGVTMTHAIAQALGGVLHVPHGVGVAIGTPMNLRYNAEQCVDVYCRLADECNVRAATPAARADRFVERIIELLRSVGLPHRAELPPDAPDDLPAKLARNAFESTPLPLKLNPRKIDEATLAELFKELLGSEPH